MLVALPAFRLFDRHRTDVAAPVPCMNGSFLAMCVQALRAAQASTGANMPR
jgi:hypothetical protein